jgi:hypothetical protein
LKGPRVIEANLVCENFLHFDALFRILFCFSIFDPSFHQELLGNIKLTIFALARKQSIEKIEYFEKL